MTNFDAIWQIAGRKVAQKVGVPFKQYRPSGVGAALSSGNLAGTPPVWITADPDWLALRPLPQNKSRGYAAFDPAFVAVGDYLVGQRWSGGPMETWFVESADLPASPTVVRCNRVLTFTRDTQAPPDPNNYGGARTGLETTILTAWPAAIEEGPRGMAGDSDLPSDTRLPWVKIFMPAPRGVQFRTADYATDSEPMPMTYIVSDAISTPMGWRLTAGLVQT